MNERSGKEIWNSAAVIRKLSKHKFGDELAQRLARALVAGGQSRKVENRALTNSHRDYCGHGLIHIKSEFHLLKVSDGLISLIDIDTGAFKAEGSLACWDTEPAFCEFWSNQSDFTCSGADPDAPLFLPQDDWSLNNQRITRRRIMDYIEQVETGSENKREKRET